MLRRVTDGIHQVDKLLPSGWRLTMTLFDVPGGVLVHSPTSIGEQTFDLVEEVGAPRVLLAPNHFHHVHLPRFRVRWPEAVTIASPRAIPRLTGKGHADLRSIDEAGELGELRLLACPFTRTGETWVTKGDTLMVCDAFFNVPGPLKGGMGFFLKMTRTGPGVKLGRTFRYLAIEDVKRYRDWANETIEELRPRRVLFSHGDPLEGDDLVPRLRAAISEALD
jgi:hypothetical protein